MNPRFRPAAIAKQALAGLLVFHVVFILAQTDNSASPQDHKWKYNALANIPAKAHDSSNPLAGDPDALAAGKKLYALHCQECHGKDARGSKRGPNLREFAIKDGSAGDLFFILTNGVVRHGMPAWSKLPEAERWQVVSFLQSLHH